MNKYDVFISGVVFTKVETSSPEKYLSTIFERPEDVEVVKVYSTQIHFRVKTPRKMEGNTTLNYITDSTLKDKSANVLFNVEWFLDKTPVPDYLPMY